MGERNAATLIVESIVATLYYEMGRFDDSEQHATNVYQLRTAVLGESNAHTLFSEALLAMLHLARGRIDEARPLYRDFLDKRMLNKNVCRRL